MEFALCRKSLLLFWFFALPLLVACGSVQPETEETSAPLLETSTTSAPSLPTDTAAPTEAPLQMPEGRLLVYTTLDYNGQYSIITFPELAAELYEPLNLDESFYDRVWSLSPGGRFLAFERNSETRKLMLLDFETGEITTLVNNHQSNGRPTWTADGRLLEFDEYSQGLTIYDTETGNARHIPVSTEFSDASAISPDAEHIAFKGGCPGLGLACPVDLYVINSDGSGEQFLEKGAMDWIFWSQDSRLIYYSLFGDRETYGNSPSLEDNGYRLYVLDIESGISTTVADPKFNTSAVDSSFLSPSGEYLVYNFGNAGLQVVRTSDGSAIELLPAGYLAWSPDSRYLVSSSYEGEWNLLDVETGQTIKLDLDLPAGSQVVSWLP
jgi:Tol biopolymer transport system component